MSCHLGDITPSTTFLTTAMALGVSKFAEWEFTTASIEWVLKLFVGGKSHFCAITNDDDDTVVNQDKRIIFLHANSALGSSPLPVLHTFISPVKWLNVFSYAIRHRLTLAPHQHNLASQPPFFPTLF